MILCSFRARILAASVVAATTLAPGAALACNPIQFLFGGCRPQPSPQPQPALENQIDRQRAPARPKRRAHAASVKQTAIAPPQGESVGSLAHFTEDKTLRRGDVVVTGQGFLVYRGAGRINSPEDFEPLTRASDDLASMEKASRNPVTYTTTSSFDHRPEETAASPLRKLRPNNRDFEAKARE
ncbi:MAG: hypothetical protein ACK5JM_01485 [Rhodoblastus sp.]